jgi:hypothetical protein
MLLDPVDQGIDVRHGEILLSLVEWPTPMNRHQRVEAPPFAFLFR